MLGSTGNIGPSYAYPEAHLNTVVVWWGLEDEALETVRENGTLSLKTTDGVAIAADDQYHTLSNTSHPFSSIATTQYDVELSKESLTGILAGDGQGYSGPVSGLLPGRLHPQPPGGPAFPAGQHRRRDAPSGVP